MDLCDEVPGGCLPVAAELGQDGRYDSDSRPEPVNMNDPGLVKAEYEDDRRLAVRRRVWDKFLDGPSSDDWTIDAVLEASPSTVLDAGAGWGAFSTRISAATGARVVAFDQSLHMARLAHDGGVRVFVGDLQALPLNDRSFDVVVANAMLYHLPDLHRGIHEAARVLHDGGRFIATTFGERHLAEMWRIVGAPKAGLPFSAETGEEVIRASFERVERREGGGVVTFPNADEVRAYI